MQKIKTALTILMTVALTAVFFYATQPAQGATSSLPGTSEDPLVSKSYVDNRVNELLAAYKNSSGAVPSTGTPSGINSEDFMLQINFLIDQALNARGAGATETPIIGEAASVRYEVISVPVGKTLVADEDGIEIVLRAGKGNVVSSTVDGLADLTTGKDLAAGEAILKNHMIIVPRATRGIKVTEAAWFMVRGAHSIY